MSADVDNTGEQPHWTVRVTSSEANRCTAFARRHQFSLGPPLTFDEEFPRATALEHFLSACGSEIVSGLLARAKRKRIEIDNVEATVDCTLDNPLTFLDVVGEQGDPGLRTLSVTVYVSTLADESAVQQLWQETLQKSPLILTLQKAMELDLRLKIVL